MIFEDNDSLFDEVGSRGTFEFGLESNYILILKLIGTESTDCQFALRRFLQATESVWPSPPGSPALHTIRAAPISQEDYPVRDSLELFKIDSKPISVLFVDGDNLCTECSIASA